MSDCKHEWKNIITATDNYWECQAECGRTIQGDEVVREAYEMMGELVGLRERIKALEGVVEVAWQEGYRRGYTLGHEDGFDNCQPRASYLEEHEWSESKARKQLEEVQGGR